VFDKISKRNLIAFSQFYFLAYQYKQQKYPLV